MVSSSPGTSRQVSAARLALVPATLLTPVAGTVVVQLPSASSSHLPPRGQSRIAWVSVRVGTVLGCESGEWRPVGSTQLEVGWRFGPAGFDAFLQVAQGRQWLGGAAVTD